MHQAVQAAHNQAATCRTATSVQSHRSGGIQAWVNRKRLRPAVPPSHIQVRRDRRVAPHRADPAPPCPTSHPCRSAFPAVARSEEHKSELQSLMRISYAVFCLKKKKNKNYLLAYSTHN